MTGKEIAHAKMENGVRIIEYVDGTRTHIYPDGTTKTF